MAEKPIPKFTVPIKCGHCQNETPMEIVADYSGVRDYYDDDSDTSWEAGPVCELCKCPACNGVTLRQYDWHSGYMDGSDIEYQIVYPFSEKGPRGLPPKIDKSYRAAQKVRNIDANAYGVLLGRVLDLVCEDRQARGETLDQKLKSLADNGEIPEKLVNVATGIRRLRNVGAHADLGELTPAELPVLDNLTRAILEYVYSAPLLATEAAERFAELKTKAKSRAKTSSSDSGEEVDEEEQGALPRTSA
jgi:hypothetical protein